MFKRRSASSQLAICKRYEATSSCAAKIHPRSATWETRNAAKPISGNTCSRSMRHQKRASRSKLLIGGLYARRGNRLGAKAPFTKQRAKHLCDKTIRQQPIPRAPDQTLLPSCRTTQSFTHSILDLPFSAVAPLLRLTQSVTNVRTSVKRGQQIEALARPAAPNSYKDELRRLRADALLLSNGPFEVFLTQAYRAPCLMRELFRQREIAFRMAGEGTGKPLDQDDFDNHYWHMLIWHEPTAEIIGAYRLAFTDSVLPNHGINGLYTSTLFEFGEALMARIGSSMELGRSFVNPRWQKSFQPLKLLWAGIATVLSNRPEVKTLFGPVSVSADLNPLSRALIKEVLSAHFGHAELKHLVRPRNPLPNIGAPEDRRSVIAALVSVDALTKAIAWLEGRNALPVLIRQYLNMNGQFAGFNVDKDFSHALDGLVFVDVKQIPNRVLERLQRSRTHPLTA